MNRGLDRCASTALQQHCLSFVLAQGFVEQPCALHMVPWVAVEALSGTVHVVCLEELLTSVILAISVKGILLVPPVPRLERSQTQIPSLPSGGERPLQPPQYFVYSRLHVASHSQKERHAGSGCDALASKHLAVLRRGPQAVYSSFPHLSFQMELLVRSCRRPVETNLQREEK